MLYSQQEPVDDDIIEKCLSLLDLPSIGEVQNNTLSALIKRKTGFGYQ